ncbi:MAG: 3-hydroxyacyl-CoA dehydrogenase family protein [Candidatus Dormiibacterota bacterium]
MSEIRKVAVVGAGTMGSQIALQTAYSGRYQVALQDAMPEQLARATEQNERLATRAVERGRRSAEEVKSALAAITTSSGLTQATSDADLVIEAVPENLDVKLEVWQRLATDANPSAVLASNSSTIAISRLAEASTRPAQCCNMHFFHPVTVMQLCEIVRGPQTSEETVATAVQFVQSIDRVPVVLQKEIHGFIANRILFAASEEALRLLEGGYASVVDIDTAVKKGLNWPMGPFELLDFSGVDIFVGAIDDRARAEGGPGAPQVLRDKVAKGELGRKTGKGFYEYPKR